MLSCDFENSNLCGYTNSAGDDFDWTRNTGSTRSGGTGPFADHTLGTRAGKIFIGQEFLVRKSVVFYYQATRFTL